MLHFSGKIEEKSYEIEKFKWYKFSKNILTPLRKNAILIVINVLMHIIYE